MPDRAGMRPLPEGEAWMVSSNWQGTPIIRHLRLDALARRVPARPTPQRPEAPTSYETVWPHSGDPHSSCVLYADSLNKVTRTLKIPLGSSSAGSSISSTSRRSAEVSSIHQT